VWGRKLELAYAAHADSTDAMKELAVTREHALESWKHALAVKKALKDHRFKEVQKRAERVNPPKIAGLTNVFRHWDAKYGILLVQRL